MIIGVAPASSPPPPPPPAPAAPPLPPRVPAVALLAAPLKRRHRMCTPQMYDRKEVQYYLRTNFFALYDLVHPDKIRAKEVQKLAVQKEFTLSRRRVTGYRIQATDCLAYAVGGNTTA